ncbi:MAG: hypothetical protein WAU62_03605 [Dehalococcoidales bacterium]
MDEQMYNSVKHGLKVQDIFVQTVAEEIGMDRAVELFAKTTEKMGKIQGSILRQNSLIKKFDAHTAAALVRAAYQSLGISIKMKEESPRSVLFTCTRCPNYTAAHELGIDDKAIESWCRVGNIRFMDMMVKQLNPDLSVRLVKFRTAPEDFCGEEIVEMIDLGLDAFAATTLMVP